MSGVEVSAGPHVLLGAFPGSWSSAFSIVWCSPVPAPSTDTRADPASARRAAEAARGRVGRAGGPLWCGPSLGAWGLFPAERLPTFSRLIAHFCSDNRPRTSLLLRAARVLATPASTAEGPRSRAARAAERPAAPSASVERASWAPDQGPVSYVPAGRPALAPDRHVQPRRRTRLRLRHHRRRPDGGNVDVRSRW